MKATIMKQRGRVDSVLMLSGIGLVTAVAALGVNMWQMSLSSGHDEVYRNTASDLRVIAQDINLESREAFSGNPAAFTKLTTSRKAFPTELAVLRDGNEEVPAAGDSMQPYVSSIEKQWNTVAADVDAILKAQKRILFVRDVSQNLNANIKTIQAYFADMVDILGGANVSSETLLAAQQQLWLIERIGRNIDRILAGGEDATAAAEEFKQDALLFQRNMEGMRNGDRGRGIDRLQSAAALETLDLAESLYAQVSGSVNDIYDAHQEIVRAAQASDDIADTAPNLSVATGNAMVHVDQLAGSRTFSGTLATILGVISLLLLAVIGFRFNGTRAQERQAQQQAHAMENEVQQKVREIQPLAEGNLSRDLSETQGITAPIAIAVNQLLDWMRSVVKSVNSSSEQVRAAVDESSKAASDVKGSLEEVGSIVADTASTSVELREINSHMSELAETTEKASNEAVSAAREGDVGIETLMVSVEEIRESQQTVAKTSKRLGDDIEIVADLLFRIREVANAISTLAMNTRIEAASQTGEGGQRFAGIADETGKLANQTNEIVQEADRAIRSVSNRMAESNRNMEGATQSLVKLSSIAADVRERFGHILSLSENARNYMADMRDQIQQSSNSSSHVTESVSDILSKTLQTQRAADRMESATNDLRSLFDRLREDTQRFKLSDDGAEPRAAQRPTVVPPVDVKVSQARAGGNQDFSQDLTQKAS
ncbi:methyl-accepting chemotaxis protein [Haliea sp. E17]|uniref:methyl-accepting chemotaxis protein n=1 Tax=Haliea sp. E17 TaxID=3401576 RepID=UPI003AAC17B5